MPIYEFICRDCRHGFEKLVPTSLRDSVACPSCSSERTVRHISLTAPAQIAASATPSCGMADRCGASECCGGMCGMPGLN